MSWKCLEILSPEILPTLTGLVSVVIHSPLCLQTRTPAASSHELTGFGGNLPSCGASMTCEPTGLRVDKVMLIDGLREVELIEDCHCEAKVTRCVRAPSLRTYFYETPYETVIDVGKCVGSKVEPGKKVAKKIDTHGHAPNFPSLE